MKIRVCCLLLAPLAVQANAMQSEAQNSAPSAVTEIEVKGNKGELEETRDLVAGKIIIDQKRIEDSGAKSVNQVLRGEPAITVSKDGLLGLMGLPGYTQILVDGKPADAGDPLDLNVLQVQRIEIIKSATAVTGPFGIAGTINIVRKNIARKASTQIQIGGESARAAYDASATWMTNDVSRDTPLSYNLYLTAERAGKTSPTSYVQTSTSKLRTVTGESELQKHDSTLIGRGMFSIKLDADHKLTWEPSFFYFRPVTHSTETRTAADQIDVALENATQSSLKSVSLPLSWDWRFDEDSALKTKLNTILVGTDLTSSLDEYTAINGVHTRSQSRQSRSRTHSFDIDYTNSVARGHDISAGARAVYNQHKNNYAEFIDGSPDFSRAILGNRNLSRVTRYQLFVQDDWRISKSLAAGAGLNVEHRVYEIDEVAKQNYPTFTMWSPTIHIAKKIDARGYQQLRLSLARTFQPPNIDQMLLRPYINQLAPCYLYHACVPNGFETADRTGNPFLQPERSMGVNLSYSLKLSKASEFMIELYTRDIANKMGWQTGFELVAWSDQPRYILRPVNLGPAKVRGTNVTGRVALEDLWHNAPALTLTSSIGFASSEISNISGSDNRIYGQLPWRAKVGAAYTAKVLPLKINLDANWLPSDWVRNNTRLRSYEASKFTVNANAGWKFAEGTNLVLGLENFGSKTTRKIDEYQGNDEMLRQVTRSRADPRITFKLDFNL